MAQVVTRYEGTKRETCYCMEKSLDTAGLTLTSTGTKVSHVDIVLAPEEDKEDKLDWIVVKE